MARDELPCHENLFIQQLEGGALDPGQDDFMGRGPLEASVKIFFCQPCVCTRSSSLLWHFFSFNIHKTLLSEAALYCICQQKAEVRAVLLDCGHYWNCVSLVCMVREMRPPIHHRASVWVLTRTTLWINHIIQLKQTMQAPSRKHVLSKWALIAEEVYCD